MRGRRGAGQLNGLPNAESNFSSLRTIIRTKAGHFVFLKNADSDAVSNICMSGEKRISEMGQIGEPSVCCGLKSGRSGGAEPDSVSTSWLSERKIGDISEFLGPDPIRSHLAK